AVSTFYSCSTLAIEVQGKQIRPVDGLAAANGTLHPVQQAFCDKDALMCGFCTPGFVMATVALMKNHPTPTLEQAKKGLDGNICRCGTFVRVLEAAMEAGKKAVARGWPEIRVADEDDAPQHPRQAARRPGQGDRQGALHLRHQSRRDDLRRARALARSARAES